jgi:protein-tyrosine-phosphatase
MLAALLRSAFQKKRMEIHVESAALLRCKSKPADALAILCMQRRGLNISTHRSRYLYTLWAEIPNYLCIVCMNEEEAGILRDDINRPQTKIIVLNEAEGGIPNPRNSSFDYEQCARFLEAEAEKLIIRLSEMKGAA